VILHQISIQANGEST